MDENYSHVGEKRVSRTIPEIKKICYGDEIDGKLKSFFKSLDAYGTHAMRNTL